MFVVKKTTTASKNWTLNKIQELEAIMDKYPPESEEYKAAQNSRERLMKEIETDPEVKKSILKMISGWGLFAGSSLLEAYGLLPPVRWFNTLRLTDKN